MSELPGKKNPWAKLLAKQGTATPRVEPPSAAPAAESPASTKTGGPPPAKPLTPGPTLTTAPRPAAKPNPWAKFRIKQNPERSAPDMQAPLPPIAKVEPQPSARTTIVRATPRPPPQTEPVIISEFEPEAQSKAVKLAGGQTSQIGDELATALGKLASEYAPLPVTSAPFVSVMEKQMEARERRLLRRKWLLKRAVGAILALGVLYAIAATMLFRFPPDEALTAEAERDGQQLLPFYSSDDQPLEVGRAVAVLSDEFSAVHLRYYAEITFRLRVPLYGPAVSNGTVNYRMLQQSMKEARAQALNADLVTLGDAPTPPDLPRLIQLVHRAGEPIVVRVPFEAKKFGWKWLIEPAQLAKRPSAVRFDGLPLSRFNDEPYLIFGLPETMPDINARTAAARAYVIAVRKTGQRQAAGDTRTSEPEPQRAAIPDQPLFPGSLPSIDPNKPAVGPNQITVPGLRPPVERDNPAIGSEKPTKPDPQPHLPR